MPPHHHDPTPTPTPPPQPPPSKPNPKLLSLLLKAIIMTLLTSLFFLFLFLGLASAALLLLHLSLSSHRLRHRRYSLPSTSFSGLPSRDLSALPHFRFKRHAPKNSAFVEDEDCVVCLDSFRDDQCCRKLVACGHVFHMRCVDSWLVKVAACPICRARVRSNAGTKGLMVSLEAEDEDKQLWGVSVGL